MKTYVDAAKLQEYTTKLVAKLKSKPARSDVPARNWYFLEIAKFRAINIVDAMAKV